MMPVRPAYRVARKNTVPDTVCTYGLFAPMTSVNGPVTPPEDWRAPV